MRKEEVKRQIIQKLQELLKDVKEALVEVREIKTELQANGIR